MRSLAAEYFELTKPRVVVLIVFTAVIGMFLAVPGFPGWRPLLLGSLGIWLAAGSAAAVNTSSTSASTSSWCARRTGRWRWVR